MVSAVARDGSGYRILIPPSRLHKHCSLGIALAPQASKLSTTPIRIPCVSPRNDHFASGLKIGGDDE